MKCREFSVGVDDALVNSDSSEISLEHTVAFSFFCLLFFIYPKELNGNKLLDSTQSLVEPEENVFERMKQRKSD